MPEATKKKTDPGPGRRTVEEITRALAAPFDPTEVKFKPAVVSGNRAMALAYVDARVIQDRLDEVLGVEGWQDSYKCLEDGSVVCRLRLRLGDEWVTKMDVGGPSEQPDGGDRLKAAFSDALKRAAVKFGIGRYLYRLPTQWVDYDSHRRQFAQAPKLPAFALPAKDKQPAPAPTLKAEPKVAAATSEPAPKANGTATTTPAPKQASPRKTAGRTTAPGMPANGAELQRRLYDYDARLAAQGLCQQGDLVKHVVEAGVKAGHDADLSTWTEPGILLAAEETRAFEAQARARQSRRKEVA